MRVAILLCFCALTAIAQQNDKTLDVVHQIKTEAFERSQVMDTLSYLTDVYGPRLTASPEFEEAAKWALQRLKEYGLSNVHEEPWGPFGRSWSIESYTIDMLKPRYSHLAASPLAWSQPTNKPVTGEVMLAPIPAREYNVSKLAKSIEEFEAKWKGKLRRKIVLITDTKVTPPRNQPNFRRYTDAQLADLAKAPAPFAKKKIDPNNFEVPEDAEERRSFFFRSLRPFSTRCLNASSRSATS